MRKPPGYSLQLAIFKASALLTRMSHWLFREPNDVWWWSSWLALTLTGLLTSLDTMLAWGVLIGYQLFKTAQLFIEHRQNMNDIDARFAELLEKHRNPHRIKKGE